MNKPVYETLIKDLAQNLEPAQPLRHPFIRMIPWVLATGVYIFLAGFVHGYRLDLVTKIQEFTFVFELSIAFFTALSAAFASAWVCVPDARGRLWVAVFPIAGLIVFILWSLMRFILEPYDYSYFSTAHCIGSAMLMGLIPGLFICFLMKKGATTRPYLLSFLNIVAVGFAGYIGLRLTCPMDTVMDGTFHHYIPYLFAGLVLGFFAKKLYHW